MSYSFKKNLKINIFDAWGYVYNKPISHKVNISGTTKETGSLSR